MSADSAQLPLRALRSTPPLWAAAAVGSVFLFAGCGGRFRSDDDDDSGPVECSEGMHDGGDGTCVEESECSRGYHDGGDRTCVAMGSCSAGFFDDGNGLCIADASDCAEGFHDDGLHMRCVPRGICASGFRDGGDGICVDETECGEGYRDGGDGTCVSEGDCSPAFHDDGEGRCVMEGVCAIGFFDDGRGRCVSDPFDCADGYHDDGTHEGCAPLLECASGYVDGGDGTCVVSGSCSPGYHDGGDGVCVDEFACSMGFHDGGGLVCLPLGTCAMGYFDHGAGNCINDFHDCADGFHDGGGGLSCVPIGECASGYTIDPDTGECGGGSAMDAGMPDAGEPFDSGLPFCCDAGPPTEPCAAPACGLGTTSTVTIGSAGRPADGAQVLIDVTRWRTAGTIAADCGDLVFREMDGTWAPHWVEACPAKVWVRARRLEMSGATLTAHHGGPPVPAAASFDRTFDRVPVHDEALVAAWTFDEGSGSTTRAAGEPMFAWHAPPGSFSDTTPASPVGSDATLSAALWGPQGGHWGTRRDVRFSAGFSAVLPDRTTWRTDPRGTPRPSRGFTVGTWFYTEETPSQHSQDWETVICHGADDAWPELNNNSWAIFIREAVVPPSEESTIRFQANSCHGDCTTFGPGADYAHVNSEPMTEAQLVGPPGEQPYWHFVLMTLSFTPTTPPTAPERHVYFDGVEMALDTLDAFFETPLPSGPIGYTNSPIVVGADLNGGADALGLIGGVDDAFILDRVVSAAEATAFYERRQPLPIMPPVSLTL